ncbi:putative ACT domain-containing protein ACR1-12 [Helianthus annuus]|nr:putative ACT domain-containing protein ACR1-12 [Helianthus annuus]
MMLANRDYKRGNCVDLDISRRPDVNAVNVYCKDCLVVTIRCTDRPRLLFDIIYTLIDMDYIVLHGYIKAERTETFQGWNTEKWLNKSESGRTNRRVVVMVYPDIPTYRWIHRV